MRFKVLAWTAVAVSLSLGLLSARPVEAASLHRAAGAETTASIQTSRAMKAKLDPRGILNPGVLI